MKPWKPAAIVFPAVLLVGCGLKQPLEPPPGESLPPAPPLASRPMTSEELLAPPPIARPERVDELLRRSEVREDDRFDLPPPDLDQANSSEEEDEPE